MKHTLAWHKHRLCVNPTVLTWIPKDVYTYLGEFNAGYDLQADMPTMCKMGIRCLALRLGLALYVW